MGCLGNILWFIFGGCVSGLGWVLAGLLWCITIIGAPIGHQCFKLAKLSFFPFGKTVEYGGGPVSLIANIFGCRLCGVGSGSLRYHNRCAIRYTDVQAGKAGSHALRS